MNKFAFWIVIVIGIAMAVVGFFNFFNWAWVNKVAAWVQSICFALGMFVVVALSYRVARNKGLGWFIAWCILVALVVFGLISNLIGLMRIF